MNYYNAIVILTCILCATMVLYFIQTSVLQRKERLYFGKVFTLILILAGLEWFTMFLNGAPDVTHGIHGILAAAGFSLAPYMLAFFPLSGFMKDKFGWITYILVGHAVLEFSSIKFGFIFYIDEANNYCRGDYFWIYMIVYLFTVAMLFISIFLCSREFQNRNMATMYGTIFFFIAGIAIQIINPEILIDWLVIAVLSVLMFIYYNDMNQQVDALTKLFKRDIFTEAVKDINYDTAVIIFDVDDFKTVNDRYGHVKGDEVLKEVAKIIKKAYSSRAYCFRIGGDEFCVIFKKKKIGEPISDNEMLEIPEDYMINDVPKPTDVLRMVNYKFDRELEKAREKNGIIPEVSLGYAFYINGDDMDEVIEYADSLMYQKKKRRKETSNSLRVK